MRLALRGANPAEWLALRVGIVPTAAAEAWGGMALSAVVITAVQTGIAARLAQQPATAAELAADLELDPVPTRLLLDCLRSGGHVRVRRGRYRLTRSARRWLGPESPLSVARYVAGSADYWSWWAQLDEVTRTGCPTGHHAVEPDDPYWHRYIRGQADLARLSAGEVAKSFGCRKTREHCWTSAEATVGIPRSCAVATRTCTPRCWTCPAARRSAGKSSPRPVCRTWWSTVRATSPPPTWARGSTPSCASTCCTT